MNHATVMAVAMEMHAVAPQPPQHMRAEVDQHDSDRGLERPRQFFRDGVAEQDSRAGKDEQRQRMAESPGQPCLTISPTSLRRAAIEDTAAI